MKSREFHRLVKKNGWRVYIQDGTSHIIYEKNGRHYPVPYHGAKEVPKGLEMKMRREMGLK